MNTKRTTARRVPPRTHAPSPSVATQKDVKVIRISAKETKVVYK